MRTGDYHSGFDDEWWCGVTTKELDDGLLPGTANYSFTGKRGLVTQLRMRGHFMDDFVKEEALDEFLRLSQILMERAIQNAETLKPMTKLKERQPFEINAGSTSIAFKRDRFSSEKGFEMILEITRSIDQTSGE